MSLFLGQLCSRNLFFHFLDHGCQLFFAFFTSFGVDVAGDALAVDISGRVFALPEVVVELVDVASASLAISALVWLEAALIGAPLLLIRWHGSVGLANLVIDLRCCLLLLGVGHMGVAVTEQVIFSPMCGLT